MEKAISTFIASCGAFLVWWGYVGLSIDGLHHAAAIACSAFGGAVLVAGAVLWKESY